MFTFTRAQAQAFDRGAMERLRIPGIVLMENAAIGCARVALSLLPARTPGRDVRAEIVCGRGNNGGDGYAIARHLMIAGVSVRLRPMGEPHRGSDAAINAEICRRLAIPSLSAEDPTPFEGELLVDALFGTGLDGEVHAPAKAIIERVNRFGGGGAPILAVDIPSGLEADTGVPLGAAVRATVTATMVAPKAGFGEAQARDFVGRVEVIPIGCPAPNAGA